MESKAVGSVPTLNLYWKLPSTGKRERGIKGLLGGPLKGLILDSHEGKRC